MRMPGSKAENNTKYLEKVLNLSEKGGLGCSDFAPPPPPPRGAPGVISSAQVVRFGFLDWRASPVEHGHKSFGEADGF